MQTRRRERPALRQPGWRSGPSRARDWLQMVAAAALICTGSLRAQSGTTEVSFSGRYLGINLNYYGPGVTVDSVTFSSLIGTTLEVPVPSAHFQSAATPPSIFTQGLTWGSPPNFSGFFALGGAVSEHAADLANRTYTVTFNGGTFDGLQQSFFLDADLLPATPTLSLAAQTALTTGNIAQDITLTLPVFTVPVGGLNPAREAYVVNRTDSITAVGSSVLTPETTTFLIPAGSLVAGKEYIFVLTDRVSSPETTGPMNDTTVVVYDGTLNVTFTAIPEPSTYALFVGLATLGLVVCRRVRTGQPVSS